MLILYQCVLHEPADTHLDDLPVGVSGAVLIVLREHLRQQLHVDVHLLQHVYSLGHLVDSSFILMRVYFISCVIILYENVQGYTQKDNFIFKVCENLTQIVTSMEQISEGYYCVFMMVELCSSYFFHHVLDQSVGLLQVLWVFTAEKLCK